MEKSPRTEKPPDLPADIDSRTGAREAIRNIYDFLASRARSEDRWKREVVRELIPLYGELDETPGSQSNGANRTVTVTVPNSVPGWAVEAAYNQDLQCLVMGTPYVSANDQVTIVLMNNTGAPVTLNPGKWRESTSGLAG